MDADSQARLKFINAPSKDKALQQFREFVHSGIDMEELYVCLHELAENESVVEFANQISLSEVLGQKKKRKKRIRYLPNELRQASDIILRHVSVYGRKVGRKEILESVVSVNREISAHLFAAAWEQTRPRLKMFGTKKTAVYST